MDMLSHYINLIDGLKMKFKCFLGFFSKVGFEAVCSLFNLLLFPFFIVQIKFMPKSNFPHANYA